MATTQLYSESIGSLVVASIVFISLLLVLVRNQYKTQQLQQRLLRLERNFRILNSSTISMGQQLLAVEKQLNGSPYTLADFPSLASSAPNPQLLQQARPELFDSTIDSTTDSSSISEKSVVSREDIRDDTIYNQARRFLNQGSSIKEVAKQCSLSYAEVSLLKALGNQTDMLSN